MCVFVYLCLCVCGAIVCVTCYDVWAPNDLIPRKRFRPISLLCDNPSNIRGRIRPITTLGLYYYYYQMAVARDPRLAVQRLRVRSQLALFNNSALSLRLVQ